MTTRLKAPTGRDPIARLRDELARRTRAGQRFAGLFGSADGAGGLVLTALVARPGGLDAVDARLAPGTTGFPSLTGQYRAAFWYERQIQDLFGVAPVGHPRPDPLILPLPEGRDDRPRPGGPPAREALDPAEPSLPRHVRGPGLFTVPHGPVRSGVFESVEYVLETPGEDIPHLRIRVFAKHRGIQKRFEGMDLAAAAGGVLLAERVEGIASVAHALAYCHAAERLAQVTVPGPARWVRVLHAELERVANHLDVAMQLCHAAGLAVADTRFGWHKERVLRLVSACCGSRFGRSVVVPGGVAALPKLSSAELASRLDRLERDIAGDERALMGTSTFLDRLRTTGPLPAPLARDYGLLGPVGRASGCHDDDRAARPYDGYAELGFTPSRADDAGDAQERLRIRWSELHTAFDLARGAVSRLAEEPDEALAAPLDRAGTLDGRAVGWAEAPQGEVVYLLEVRDGTIRRCAPRSASFHNLVAFPETFVGDIFTDFPFTEASFGLPIAGVVC